MMKRATYLLTFILCQLAVVSASADDISLTEARNMASHYVTMPSVQKSKVNKAAAATGKFMNDFYCFNDASGKGFVLISDDNCVQPILGYSDSGTFDVDNVPVQLQDWLTAVSQYISQNKAAGKTVSVRKVKGTPVVAPLVTTKWWYMYPFNTMTPIAGASTGCVAVAMAQIMYYHKWPARGQGSHTYTSYCKDDSAHATYTTKEISMDFSQSVYDYANMLDEYKTTKDDNQWTEAQAAAVSKLMLDCGVAANMHYGVTVSSTYTQDAAYGLSEYFDYNTKYYNHNILGTPGFLKVIKDELDDGYPLYFSSSSSANGHSFVVDGYDSNGFLHANFGFSGRYDGYYDICDMDGYCYTQGCITAHPNRTGEKSDFIFATAIQNYHPDVFHHGGKNIINEPINDFSVTLDSLFANFNNDYEGYQALALYQGERLVELLDTVPVSLRGTTTHDGQDQISYLDSLTLNVRKSSIDTLADGAYTIVPVSFGKKQLQSGKALSAADVAKSLVNNHKTLPMEINNGKMTVCCVAPSYSLDWKCVFARDTTYRAGLYDWLSIPVKIQNNDDGGYQQVLLATLTKAGTTECDTLFCNNYLIYDHYTRIFEANKQIISKSQVGRYVYALGYYNSDGTYVPLISPADSVMVEIYADSTCEKPTLTATLDNVTDYDTGNIMDMDNLRTGGEGEPTTYTLHYKVKYTGKTNVPYTLRFTANGQNLGVYVTLKYNLSDTICTESGNINAIYQKLHAYYGITTFQFSMQYKLPDDTEWQPLDKNRPYLVINPVSSGISSAQSADGATDTSVPYNTLQGMKVQQPAAKGIYIRKGKKMVIR